MTTTGVALRFTNLRPLGMVKQLRKANKNLREPLRKVTVMGRRRTAYEMRKEVFLHPSGRRIPWREPPAMKGKKPQGKIAAEREITKRAWSGSGPGHRFRITKRQGLYGVDERIPPLDFAALHRGGRTAPLREKYTIRARRRARWGAGTRRGGQFFRRGRQTWAMWHRIRLDYGVDLTLSQLRGLLVYSRRHSVFGQGFRDAAASVFAQHLLTGASAYPPRRAYIK